MDGTIEHREPRHEGLVACLPDAIVVVDPGGTIAFASPQVERLYGWLPGDLVGRSMLEVIHPDDAPLATGEWTMMLDGRGGGYGNPLRLRIRHGHGSWVPVELMAANFVDDAVVQGVVVSVRDVRERVRSAAPLRDVEIRFRHVFEAAPIGVGIAGPDGRFVSVNPAFRAMLGYEEEDMLGHTFADFTHPDDLARNLELFAALARDDRRDYTLDKRFVHKDGNPLWCRVNVSAYRDESGEPRYYIGHVEDITEQRGFEQRLSHEASHDPLTKLPLRTLLLDRLDLALAGARRRDTTVAVLFIDLDHFKRVNDNLGHVAGDDLLRAVAERLRGAVREIDTPGRFGGDEFVVVCPDLAATHDAVGVAERVRVVLSESFEVRGFEVFVGASIGIAIADSGVDGATLLRQADIAAYRAKERGRNRYEIFDDELRATIAARLDTEIALRRSLDRDEIRLVYQPIVDLATGAIRGFEALARWDRPGHGLVSPADFLSVAEDTGLVVPLGMRVLERATHQLAHWRDTFGHVDVPFISVNVSALQLAQADFARDVGEILRARGLAASSLWIEVPDTALGIDQTHVHGSLHDLGEIGAHLAIGDFGTVYSPLPALRALPVRTVKIDRHVTAGLDGSEDGTQVVAAVIGLARALGLDVAAVGVETAMQYATLRSLGCSLAQGYYLSPPVPADIATRILDAGALPRSDDGAAA